MVRLNTTNASKASSCPHTLSRPGCSSSYQKKVPSPIYEVRLMDYSRSLKVLLFLMMMFFVQVSLFHLASILSELGYLKGYSLWNWPLEREMVSTLFHCHPVFNIIVLMLYFVLCICTIYAVLQFQFQSLQRLIIGHVVMSILWMMTLIQHTYHFVLIVSNSSTVLDSYVEKVVSIYSPQLLFVSCVLNGAGFTLGVFVSYLLVKFRKRLLKIMIHQAKQTNLLKTV